MPAFQSPSAVLLAPLLTVLAITGCGQAATEPAQAEQSSETAPQMAISDVSLVANDGLTINGRYYRADQPKAIILLFHQAGSSLAEYATIAPKLVEQGYSVLAIDQRLGGTMFGPNQTASRLGKPATFNDVLHDLEAALVWSRAAHLPVIAWGSSYSAALVYKLAERHPSEITALLAFSPGEYLGPGKPVAKAAAALSIPVYISVGSGPDELSYAKPIFAATGSSNKVLYVPKIGVHGSSTLSSSRNAKGAQDNWISVNRFLTSVAGEKVQRPPVTD